MAREYYEIPLTSQPQRFSVFLGRAQWFITLRWNNQAHHWVLDFHDSKQTLILAGLMVTTGADLLAQHQHLGFEGALIAQSTSDPLEPPNFENLGTTSHLIFVYESEA